jgi:hypothetical protein
LADLVEAHCRRDRKTDNPAECDSPGTQRSSNPAHLESVACRVRCLTNETKTRKRDPRQSDGLSRECYSVNCGRVRQDGLDVTEINTESDRASAFPRPLFSELDDQCAIELRKSQPPQRFREMVEARRLGSPDGLSYLLNVFAMQAD